MTMKSLITWIPLATIGLALAARNATETKPWSFFWDADLFHLPPDGFGWLDRLESEPFHYQNKTYSSPYAAMVSDPHVEIHCRNLNAYFNSAFVPPAIAGWILHVFGLTAGYFIICYIRNFIGGCVVYYAAAGIFHYFCYVHPQANRIFAKRPRPTAETMWDQIRLAQASLFLYVLLPVVDELLVEYGYTKTYYTVPEIGGYTMYAATLFLYIAFVEIAIYWMHRTLHTNKWLYKHVHVIHHQYNTAQTLTPWASIAFHPLDGILQCCPYVIGLFVVPTHYLTHMVLLFFSAVWATYIHDAMDWNVGQIMGSKYHTVHHTHYVYNYGQFFTFCDRFWGTFREPAGPTGFEPLVRTKPVSSRMGSRSKWQ